MLYLLCTAGENSRSDRIQASIDEAHAPTAVLPQVQGGLTHRQRVASERSRDSIDIANWLYILCHRDFANVDFMASAWGSGGIYSGNVACKFCLAKRVRDQKPLKFKVCWNLHLTAFWYADTKQAANNATNVKNVRRHVGVAGLCTQKKNYLQHCAAIRAEMHGIGHGCFAGVWVRCFAHNYSEFVIQHLCQTSVSNA